MIKRNAIYWLQAKCPGFIGNLTASKFITRRRSCTFAEYWKHFVAPFNDVHAFGYNYAGSERIWMKFGALRVYCLELALADFGCDPRRSESGSASRNFFCQVNNARLYRFPVSQISRNLHTRRGSMSPWILSENIFENLPVRSFFLKKNVNFCLIVVNDFRLQATISPKWMQIAESHDRLSRLRNAVVKQLDGSRCHLVWRYVSAQTTLC